MRKLKLLALLLAILAGGTARANEPARATSDDEDHSHLNVALFLAATYQRNGGDIGSGEGGFCFEGHKHKFGAEVCAGASYDSHHAVGGLFSVAFYRTWKRVWLGGGFKLSLDHPTKEEEGKKHPDLLSGVVTGNLTVIVHHHFHLYFEAGSGVQGPIAKMSPEDHGATPLFIMVGGISVPLIPKKKH